MSDSPIRPEHIEEGPLDPSDEAIDRAMREAVTDALLDHKRAGNPIATWLDGNVVWISPEEIVNRNGGQREVVSETVRVSTPDDFRNELIAFEELIQRVGLRLNPSSRLAAFSRRNLQFARKELHVVRGINENNEALLEGGRDFAELSVAARALLPSADPALLKKFQSALGGASSATGESNPASRNIQFELFLAAILRSAGVQVVFAEPDLRLRCGEQMLGIAVKRILSAERIPREVHEGGKQIERQGLRGFVALSLDHLIEDDNYRIEVANPEQLLLQAKMRAAEVIDGHFEAIRRQTEKLPVLGLYISFVQLGIMPQTNGIGHAELVYPVPFRDRWTQADWEALKVLSGQLKPIPPIR